MKHVLLLGLLAGVAAGCAGQRYTDPRAATASEKWHRQIVAAFPGYKQTTSTKVLAACIKWPEALSEQPQLLAGGWAYTGQTSDIQIFTGDLSRSAMNLCRGNAASGKHDCECQFVDKNHQNTLKIPPEILTPTDV